jgi:hypothetical protein
MFLAAAPFFVGKRIFSAFTNLGPLLDHTGGTSTTKGGIFAARDMRLIV